MTENTIKYLKFDTLTSEYGWASNFFPTRPLVIDGETWLTSEQYFQAMKFRGPFADAKSIEYSNLIKDADSPAKVKCLGSQRTNRFGGKWVVNKKTDKRLLNDMLKKYRDVKIRSDWDSVKIPVMIKTVAHKFSLPEMERRIKSIPDNGFIVENTKRDRFWGDGGDGGTGEKGQNALGKILTCLSHIIKYGSCDRMNPELKKAVLLRMRKSKQETNTTKILSWNINGIRSNILSAGKYKCSTEKTDISPESNLGAIIKEHNPDIICMQETRCDGDISQCIKITGYHQYWNCSSGEGARSGNRYSGTAVWTKKQPIHVFYGLPNLDDHEGRILLLEFEDFWLLNTYVPNAGTNFDYRTKVWDLAILEFLQRVKINNKKLIWAGDLNVARFPIDVFWGDPSSSSYDKAALVGTGRASKPGYTKEERDHMEQFLEAGYSDVYRTLNPDEKGAYTWFNPKIPAFRMANKGWRIDYFIVSNELMPKVRNMSILYDSGLLTTPHGSDHLAILLEIRN